MSIEQTKEQIKALLVGLSIFEIDEILQNLKFEIRKDLLYTLPFKK